MNTTKCIGDECDVEMTYHKTCTSCEPGSRLCDIRFCNNKRDKNQKTLFCSSCTKFLNKKNIHIFTVMLTKYHIHTVLA